MFLPRNNLQQPTKGINPHWPLANCRFESLQTSLRLGWHLIGPTGYTQNICSDSAHICSTLINKHMWLWVNNRGPKWNPGKWKSRPKPAQLWVLIFEPHTCAVSCGPNGCGCHLTPQGPRAARQSWQLRAPAPPRTRP